MSKTLDEFMDYFQATKLLKTNLRENMEVFCEDMTEEDKEALLRMNLIMFRQCLNDFGIE